MGPLGRSVENPARLNRFPESQVEAGIGMTESAAALMDDPISGDTFTFSHQWDGATSGLYGLLSDGALKALRTYVSALPWGRDPAKSIAPNLHPEVPLNWARVGAD